MRPFLLQWLANDTLKAIGWTLIHSLWQGLLAAVLAGVIIIVTKKATARLRYNLLGMVMMLFVIAAIVTFAIQLKGNVREKVTSPSTQWTTAISYPVIEQEMIITAPATGTVARFITWFNSNADFFVLAWAIFFFIHCMKLLRGLAGVRRIRNYRTHTLPGKWTDKMNQLAQSIRLKRRVSLLQSELVKVPVAIGFFKPVILFPMALVSHLPPEQVETILLHELAHVRRNDYLVNILQRFTEAVFFFNPALLWISSLLRQEREACCDDIVMAHVDHKNNYLEALVSFQEYSLASRGWAMAITSRRHYLLNRVKRMITLENKKLNVMEKIVLIAGLVAFTAFSFIPKKEKDNEKKDFTAIAGTAQPVVELPRSTMIPKAPVTRIIKPVVKNGELVQPVKDEELMQPVINEGPLQSIKDDMLQITVQTPPTDTVPDKGKKKAGYDGLKFPSISSSVNDDGKARTENTTVTDQDGKKYSYTKKDNKLTSLVVDGRTIPESEYDSYSGLLDRIQVTMEENRAKRSEEMALRKVQRVLRSQEIRNRAAEQRLLRNYNDNREKTLFLNQNLRLKLLQQSNKNPEKQRKEVMRLMQQLKQKKQRASTLNGREVIKIDLQDPVVVKAVLKNEVNLLKPVSLASAIQPTIKTLPARPIYKSQNIELHKMKPLQPAQPLKSQAIYKNRVMT